MQDYSTPQGAGLGFRRSMLNDLPPKGPDGVDFLEIAPENWIRSGAKLTREFSRLAERYPFVTHGLSLSIGGTAALDRDFLDDLKTFLDQHRIDTYTEHLSYCADDGHLYDLMPIPFTEEAVRHVARRVAQVNEQLERRIALENVSFYAMPTQAMTELEFLLAVLEEADCDLLLDVNNIYVNSINHQYSAADFLAAIPGERIRYIHVAGHYNEADDLIIDTHGAEVIDPVWALLAQTYRQFGALPTLLERDFNIPPVAELLQEVHTIRQLQQNHAPAASRPADATRHTHT